jgi:hypothetical protein
MYTTFSVEIDEKLQKDFLKEIKIRRAKKEKILAKLMYFYIKNLIITDEEYKDDIAFDLAVTKAFQDK